MINLTITDNTGTHWKRVNRRKAKRLFESNQTIMLCPHKMNPFGQWQVGASYNRLDDESRSFDRLAMNSTWYNCNNETGNYLAYYVKVQSYETLICI